MIPDPVEDRLEGGAATAGEAIAVEAGRGAFIELLDLLDSRVALDDGESALGDRTELVEFAKDLGEYLIRHRTGGVNGNDDMVRAGSAHGGEVEAPPEVFFVRGKHPVVVAAQAGEEAGDESSPGDIAAAGLADFLLEETGGHAAQLGGHRLGQGDAESFAFLAGGKFLGADGLPAEIAGGDVEVPALGRGGPGAFLAIFLTGLVLRVILDLAVNVLGGHATILAVKKPHLRHCEAQFHQHEIGGVIDGLIPQFRVAAAPPINVSEDAVHELVGEDKGDLVGLKVGAEVRIDIDIVSVGRHRFTPWHVDGIDDREAGNGGREVRLAKHELDAGLEDLAW